MKGLLLKDFYMITKYCRSFSFIIVVFLLVSCFGKDNSFFAIYPNLIAGMIPLTLISYDERDKWNVYSETFPYTRGQIVSSKYLIGLLCELVVFILSSLLHVYRMMSLGQFSFREYFSFVIATFVIGLIAPSIILPFIFKFGAEKGRIVYYVIIGIMCAAGGVLFGNGFMLAEKMSSSISMILVIVVAVVIYMCSWGLSVLFYKKRDIQ